MALSPIPSRSSRSRARDSATLRLRPAITAGITTFSSTVMPSSRLKNWNTMPTCWRRMIASAFSSLPASDSPAITTSPSSGTSRPATRFSIVDFPHPDGPITATNSPVRTVRSAPRNARTGAVSCSNVRYTAVTSTAGPVDGGSPVDVAINGSSWTGSSDVVVSVMSGLLRAAGRAGSCRVGGGGTERRGCRDP